MKKQIKEIISDEFEKVINTIEKDFPKNFKRKRHNFLLSSFDRETNANMVFDPFMGVGSMGVAALKLGRRFMGCEIEPQYYQASVERLEKVIKDPL